MQLQTLSLIVASVVFVEGTFADDKPKLPAKKQFHLYLLIGQSNMAGRGKIEAADKRAHPRVLKLDKRNKWVPATAPLHYDKPKIAGVGLGGAFGRAMADADKSVTIGLIPCAFGGTPLRRWEAGGDLYRNAVQRAKLAMKSGTLKGVLWHQGESDSRSTKTATTYGKRLAGMINALRKDLANPHLPVVVGELGHFLNAKRLPHFKTVNQALLNLPKSVQQTACVSAKGLKPKRDGVHFDRKSLIEFGKRYAEKMRKLQAAGRGRKIKG